MLRDTPTKQFRHTLSQLGPEYTSKIIDGELCGYLKINETYDIEISGMNNNRVKRPNFNIYVWDCSPGYRIVEQHHNIKSIDHLREILLRIREKYQNSNPNP